MTELPRPGTWVELNGERARVVGEFPADESKVPVQTQDGRLVLVEIERLEEAR